jgi:Xaa-Pro aminopeptidase
MADVITDEAVRTARLLDAQARAATLFEVVEQERIVRPGRTERQASDDIRDKAAALFGIERFWHKRIVRAGPNTLHPYQVNPPDRVIAEDDIAFCDFGPIFEEWEADFGRTFVLGDDPTKHRLRADLGRIWSSTREHFRATPDITGEQLYAHVVERSREAGWEFGNRHAGHLVGQFPHEKIVGDDIEYYITPTSDQPMRRVDRTGAACHWILEVHLIDREREIGGFQEELLDLGPA